MPVTQPVTLATTKRIATTSRTILSMVPTFRYIYIPPRISFKIDTDEFAFWQQEYPDKDILCQSILFTV